MITAPETPNLHLFAVSMHSWKDETNEYYICKVFSIEFNCRNQGLGVYCYTVFNNAMHGVLDTCAMNMNAPGVCAVPGMYIKNYDLVIMLLAISE